MAEFVTKLGRFRDRQEYLEFRRELQSLISDRRHEVVKKEIAIEAANRCASCHCELDAWTAGCKRCQQRHYKRVTRGTFRGGILAFLVLSEMKTHAALSLALEARPRNGNSRVFRTDNAA